MTDKSICVRVMFVDDEENILKTLKRMMSFEDFECSFANSGKEALEMLNQQKHDIIISDMRMPEMNGDEFLALAKGICPHSMRFILSGYSDFNSMVSALNEGGIHQFISKPWDQDKLLEKINEAAEFIRVRGERDRLTILTKRQALLLKEANKTLEAKVESRTQEVQQTADMLDLSYQELKTSYSIFIDVIAQVLQLRSIAPKDHLNDIAATAKALASTLKMTEDEQDSIYKAAKLHELGKIRIPDSTLNRPINSLSGQELADYKSYPLQGYSLMASLDNLNEVSTLIKAHCEYFNGKGFPNHLAGEKIPLGSRIIAISMHYFTYRNGLIDGQSHTEEDADRFIRSLAGRVVDPDLLEPFLASVAEELAKKGKFESRIAIDQAEPGMTLSRDLFNLRGVIMLTKGAVLTEKIITKLEYISEKESHNYVIYIDNVD